MKTLCVNCHKSFDVVSNPDHWVKYCSTSCLRQSHKLSTEASRCEFNAWWREMRRRLDYGNDDIAHIMGLTFAKEQAE